MAVKNQKHKVAEEEERLDILGQSSDRKAAKWIIEDAKEKEKDAQSERADSLTKLQDKRKQVKGYKEILMTNLYQMVDEIRWPKEYEYGVWYDGKGVILAIKDKRRKLHKRAFKPCFIPKIDFAACQKFAVWAEDVLDAIEGRLSTAQSEGGIWLPKKS
jgi:hypothetical protein